MKKWQENRNYRHIYDSDGNVTANIITVDGQDIAVSEEVFQAYAQMDRKERYQIEQLEAHPQASLEQLAESFVPIERYMRRCERSAEAISIQKEDQQEQQLHIRKLRDELIKLTPEEQRLIHALFFEGISVREYARREGVYHRTIQYRLEKVLMKLREKIFS